MSEDTTLHNHLCENLKSYIYEILSSHVCLEFISDIFNEEFT
jgi:hypothetical protein